MKQAWKRAAKKYRRECRTIDDKYTALRKLVAKIKKGDSIIERAEFIAKWETAKRDK